MIFFCGLGRRYRVSRTGRFACLDEAVSVVTSVSEHARALELNPRNIHTEAPSRYYRGIIQTYLYPSPMTADMTCDRLRYRLHDMPRSLSPSVTISFPHSLQPFPTLSHPTAINFGKRFARTRRNQLVRSRSSCKCQLSQRLVLQHRFVILLLLIMINKKNGEVNRRARMGKISSSFRVRKQSARRFFAFSAIIAGTLPRVNAIRFVLLGVLSRLRSA